MPGRRGCLRTLGVGNWRKSSKRRLEVAAILPASCDALDAKKTGEIDMSGQTIKRSATIILVLGSFLAKPSLGYQVKLIERAADPHGSPRPRATRGTCRSGQVSTWNWEHLGRPKPARRSPKPWPSRSVRKAARRSSCSARAGDSPKGFRGGCDRRGIFPAPSRSRSTLSRAERSNLPRLRGARVGGPRRRGGTTRGSRRMELHHRGRPFGA